MIEVDWKKHYQGWYYQHIMASHKCIGKFILYVCPGTRFTFIHSFIIIIHMYSEQEYFP